MITAALAAGIVTLVVWASHSGFRYNGFLFVSVPAVGVAAYLGGRAIGLIVAAAGLIASWYVVGQPAHVLATRSDGLPVLLLVAAAGVLSVECAARIREAETRDWALALIVQSSDDAIYGKTLDGTILTWNAGAERQYGYTAAEVIGRPVSVLAAPERVDEIPEILARLRRGERVDHYESVRVKKDGTRVDVSLTISPIRDPLGRIIGAATIARDITERKRAEEVLRRRRAEDEVINVIATQIAGETHLDRLLAASLAQLHQRVAFTGGSIALIEGDDLVIQAAVGPFADAAHGQRLRRGEGYVWRVVETGTPFLCNDLLLGGFTPTTPIRSYLAVPLIWQARILGVLEVDSPAVGTFAQADLELLQRVAVVIGGSVETARLYEREHRVASTLQRALLPEDLPHDPGVDIHATYLPGASESDVGGDWYDAFRLPDGRLAVSVGDVAGRGLNAAAVMGQLRHTIRAAALQGHDPAAVLEQVGKIFAWTSDGAGMATALFGIVDSKEHAFTYAVAGHPLPVVATPTGDTHIIESAGSLPLGIAGGTRPPLQSIPLPPGTLLVLYTDGLIELTRDAAAGEAALVPAVAAERLAPSDHPAQGIVGRVLQGRQSSDDIAVVTVSISAAPARALDMTLPAEPRAAAAIRQAFKALAAAHHVDPGIAALFEVALGEAVNNAVEHAYGAMRGVVHVRAWRDGDNLIAEIEDHGQWRQESRGRKGGYGLRIMRELLDSADVTRTHSGTVVRLGIDVVRRSRSAASGG